MYSHTRKKTETQRHDKHSPHKDGEVHERRRKAVVTSVTLTLVPEG